MARPKMPEGLKKISEIRLMVTKDRKATIVQAAKDMGYASTTDFLNAAIDEMMKGCK